MRMLAMVAVVSTVTLGGALAAQQQPSPASPPAQQPSAALPPMPSGNVEHGRYLVENVVHCVECHSTRDSSGNIMPDTRFQGGPIPFQPPWPANWATAAPRNKGLPGYTDQLALRLFTQGSIDRRGNVLRPPMPRFYMTPQDAADVIAYMRSMR